MKFCGHCGESINENVRFCPHCGKANGKKKHMLLYFILMIMLFIVFEIGSEFIYSASFEIISLSKYGNYIIIESLWALTVFIMLVFAGNAYIFRWKKVPIRKSLALAVPPVAIAIMTFFANFASAFHYNFIDVIGLAFYCFTIGLTEEFMCRGWLLTEFIERYGYDYKHVKLSILASALIFGFMHLTNIFAGQTIFETLMQVIQTLGIGYLLGSVFYRTRNIWSVVFIHAFYDFSLMLGDISRYAVCTGGESQAINFYSFMLSTILCVIYFAVGEYNLRKTETYKLLPEVKELTENEIKDSKRTTSLCKTVIITCLCLIILLGFININEEKIECKPYHRKTISGNYSIKKVYYKEYEFYENNTTSLIYIKGDKYYKKNMNTNEEVELTDLTNDLIVIHNENYNALAYYNKKEDIIHYEMYEYNSNSNTKVKEFKVPKIETFGVLESDTLNEYIFFTSQDIEYGMIDSDLELYEITFDD